MIKESTLVIVGGGLAGAKAAEGARTSGYQGRIVIAGDEGSAPYERPQLSKTVLRGEADLNSTLVFDGKFYADQAIEVRTGTAVAGVKVNTRQVEFADGSSLGFNSLVFATGAVPRQSEIPGAGLDGVYYLRTAADSMRLQAAIRKAARVAVIGGGWIGSEVAASARMMGADVVLIDPGLLPLHRVLGTKVAVVFRQLHYDHGVELRLGVGAVELRGSRQVEQVVLSDGRIENADVVVIGIGALPRVELAVEAGLQVENGIVVDENLETSVPGIFAAGDIANAWHPHYQRRLRVEHWANARYQGAAAGRNATSHREAYDRLPYFYSDQFDLSLEYVGHAESQDEVVVRGDLEGRKCVAMYHRDGVVTAALTLNVTKVFKDLKAIISSGVPMDLKSLADPDIPFADLVPVSA